MTYFEISKDILGGIDARQLDRDEAVKGNVNGSPVALQVLTDAAIFKSGRLQFGPEGATVFDKPHWYSTRKAVVYLDISETWSLEYDKVFAEELGMYHFYNKALSDVFNLALEQSGAKRTRQNILIAQQPRK